MATVKEIYLHINARAPFDTQLSFDNSGLLLGRGGAKVTRVLISLDLSEAVAAEAAALGAQLVITHHPIIFHPVRAVTDDDATGRTLLLLAESGVAAICAHTNLDIAAGGVNDALAARLGVEGCTPLGEEGVVRAGLLSSGPMPLAAFAARVKAALDCPGLRAEDSGRPAHRVAVGGGACAEDLGLAVEAGCDTFVTADVNYHTFLEARALGVNLLDAGHYATEQVVCPVLETWLREGFPGLEVLQTAAHRGEPRWF